MNPERKYRKPPVVEALCEIYFEDSEWDETLPGIFYDNIKQDFPLKRERDIKEATLPLSDARSPTFRRLTPWMQFLNKEENRMVQLRENVLVVNSLAPPYGGFKEWSATIEPNLAIYEELAKPKSIKRLGLRYINRVVIRNEFFKLSDYFEVYPRVPDTMVGVYEKFLFRAEVPSKANGHRVVLTFTTVEASAQNEHCFLLDIHDTIGKDLSASGISAVIETAHANVISAFEGSITDELRSLFDPEA